MRKILFPAFAAAMLLVSGAAMALPMYTITDLGVLPDWDYSYATDINDSGQVVGYSQTANLRRAFLWQSGVMTDLGELPGGNNFSSATGVNNSGQIVGYSHTESGNHAFSWQNGSMDDFGDLPGGQDASHAYAINDSGQVVGQGYDETGARGVLWNNGVGIALWDSAFTPFAINNMGQVVGPHGDSTGIRSFMLQNGEMTDLGDLPGGLNFSYAQDVNNIGQVVGTSFAETYLRAFLWQNGEMINLGDLPGGGDYSEAYGVNDSGSVVGTSSSATTSNAAFLWQDGVGMMDLNDMVVEPNGWSIYFANAINESGQIAANGYNSSLGFSAHALLLTPVDAPPATDIQYININSNGVISGESFNPAYPTVVVTHGWQPEADDPLSQSFPLSDVSQAVAARALHDDQPLNLITYQWAAAYTEDTGGSDYFSRGTLIRFNAAASGTKSAGSLLGNRLENLFEDSGYTGPVHMIGHSFGTAVNAWALDYAPSLNIDQFTILDAPSDVPPLLFECNVADLHCILPMQFTSDWFNTRLPQGQVTYVDNFYGTGQGSLNPLDAPAVGTPILGAAGGHFGASGGEELSGANHGEVHEIYSERVEDDLFWTSPIFGLDNIHFSGRPGPGAWQPNPAGGLIAIGGELSDYPTWTATQGSVEITTLGLDVGGTISEIIAMVLNPNSPVSITRPFDIPVGATLLSFDFGFLDPGTGEFLQLFFDDILLWETPWMNDLVGELLNAVVPIGSLAGLSGDLTFLLDSTTGDASARAFIANFEVMGSFARTAAVPEPGTLFLIGTGLLGLTRLRHASARHVRIRRKSAA